MMKKIWLLAWSMATMLSFQAVAQQPLVEWRAPYFPPFYEQPAAGNVGVLDRVLLGALGELPQYDHRFQHSNFARLLYDARQGQLICSHALIRTPEREEYLRFSEPLFSIFSPGIVIRQADYRRFLPYMGRGGKVSLTQLLTDSALVIGFQHDRVYGRKVNELLASEVMARRPVATNVEVWQDSLTLMTMLVGDRFDFVLGHSSEAQYFSQQSGSGVKLRFLALQEQDAGFPYQYSCTATPEGEAIIASLNRVIARAGFRQQAAEAYRDTLLPDDRRKFELLNR